MLHRYYSQAKKQANQDNFVKQEEQKTVYLIVGLCPSGIFRDTPTSAGPLRKSTFTDFPITQTASFR